MKNLQSYSSTKGYFTMLLVAFTLLISCDSNGQKSEGVDIKMTIHEATFMGNVEQVKAHIESNTDLNQKDAYGSSPLTIAALFGKNEIAKLLIDAGADINVKSADGSTPLHTASFFCRTEIAKMLLEKGADTSLRNNYGSTALESISGSFTDVKPIYDQMSRDLGPFGLKLDYDHIKTTRPVIAELIKSSK